MLVYVNIHYMIIRYWFSCNKMSRFKYHQFILNINQPCYIKLHIIIIKKIIPSITVPKMKKKQQTDK